MSDFTGYVLDREDSNLLKGLDSEEAVLALMGSYEEVRLDPRKIIRVENQSRQGACAGHSLSSILEWIFAIATGGKIIQLSRAMAYYATQEIDGIRGDRGSTVMGGVKLAKTKGVCREELWKYPSTYDNRWPQNRDAVLADAKNYRIETATRITTYEGFRAFLGSGQGGIHTGIAWGDSMNRAVVEKFVPGGGGHSICGLCLSERTDSRGEPYAFIQNSWSESFGNGGWQEWSPTAIRQMLQHSSTVFVGLSDMPEVKPREWTLKDTEDTVMWWKK